MSDYSNQSDLQLIVLLRSGDEGAFQEIYLRYNSLLLAYAYKKLQDLEGAKDVIQDVFIYLWANRTDFNLETTLAGYLYKAVLNKMLNIFRHQTFCAKYVEEINTLMTNHTERSDYLIREKEIGALIEREIAALPPRMRQVFELRQKKYLSNKEIAEHLNLSEHTVATQMKKSLKVLRTKLGNGFLFNIFFL
ncbi:ECF RNA polymerase sigma factor SigW [compost metagenome]